MSVIGIPKATSTVRVIASDCQDLPTHVARNSAMLVYMDPPFAVGTQFRARAKDGRTRASGAVAYDDRWPSIEAYLAWLAPRLVASYSLLRDDGTLWLHLDHRAIHEAKVLAEQLFGAGSYRGEVIWVPGNGTKARNGPGVTHQTLLIFAKTDDFCWNADDPVLREPFAATSLSMHFTHTDSDGRLFRERVVGGKTYRYYADKGRALGSVWTDCPAMVANTPLRAEGTGYPTQKPEKLLDRIVRATTLPGALVVDPFCGSGTTLVAAAMAGRAATGGDIGELALATTRERLRKKGITIVDHVYDAASLPSVFVRPK